MWVCTVGTFFYLLSLPLNIPRFSRTLLHAVQRTVAEEAVKIFLSLKEPSAITAKGLHTKQTNAVHHPTLLSYVQPITRGPKQPFLYTIRQVSRLKVPHIRHLPSLPVISRLCSLITVTSSYRTYTCFPFHRNKRCASFRHLIVLFIFHIGKYNILIYLMQSFSIRLAFSVCLCFMVRCLFQRYHDYRNQHKL